MEIHVNFHRKWDPEFHILPRLHSVTTISNGHVIIFPTLIETGPHLPQHQTVNIQSELQKKKKRDPTREIKGQG